MPRSSNHSFLQQSPFPCNDPLLFVIPSVPGFPASLLSPATTDVVLSKENHTQLTEAATLDRKSGEADLSRRAEEGSAVRHSCAPLLPAHNLPQSSPNPHGNPTPLCHSGFPGGLRGTADPSASLRRKTFPRRGIHTEISPFRCAPVEMTKGRAALPGREVAE
jgi:hypothetical protein